MDTGLKIMLDMSDSTDILHQIIKQKVKPMAEQKDVTPKPRRAAPKTTGKSSTKTATKEKPVTIDVEQKTKQVPMLRKSDGSSMELTIQNIQSMGADKGQALGNLSDEVLSKVKIANSGELGEGISQILNITRNVDISKLGTKPTNIVSRVINIFSNTQQKVLDQFNTSADQIEQISSVLQEGVQRMRGETVWLDNVYNANIEHLYELEAVLENVLDVQVVEEEKKAAILAEENPAIEVLENQRSICVALDKQADKLRRLIQLARLTAPQIASMKAVNTNTIEKFESLNMVIIPAWKSNMSLSLISQQQAKDNLLSNDIDDATNRLLVDNSEKVSKNMKDAAKAAQRGVVDIESLRAIQNNMISGIKDTIAIENQGAIERQTATKELEHMHIELKSALMEISVAKANRK